MLKFANTQTNCKYTSQHGWIVLHSQNNNKHEEDPWLGPNGSVVFAVGAGYHG